jgi:hypothetical protein
VNAVKKKAGRQSDAFPTSRKSAEQCVCRLIAIESLNEIIDL